MAHRDPLTYHYPRTLEQAFGPGERGNVKADSRPFFQPQDRPVMVTVAVGVLAILAAACIGGLS